MNFNLDYNRNVSDPGFFSGVKCLGGIMKTHSLFAVLAFLALIPSSIAAEVTIAVPCDASGTATAGFLRKCSEVVPDLQKALDTRVMQLSENFHKTGVTANPAFGADYSEIFGASGNKALETANSNPSERNLGKPVCSASANPFTNNKAEVKDNMLGESCGDPTRLSVNVQFQIGRRGFPKRPYVQSTSTQVTWNIDDKYGKREAAYIRGMLIQAMSCYTAQVKNEVERQKMFKVTQGCSAVETDIANLGREYQATALNLKAELGAEKNYSDIWNCKNTWDASDKKAGMDVGMARQSAQHLCASRAAQETMFKQLMACEVFNRSGIDFRAFMNDQSALFRELKAGPGNNCRNQCYNECRSCSPGAGCNSCTTACSNRCYGQQVATFFTNKGNSRWPNSGTCRNITPLNTVSNDDSFINKLMEVASHE